MRNLLNFFIRYGAWFLFVFYAAISCFLLFQRNPFQHHVYLTSANAVVSGVYDVAANVTGYINLRDINADLQRRTADLESEVIALREHNRASSCFRIPCGPPIRSDGSGSYLPRLSITAW